MNTAELLTDRPYEVADDQVRRFREDGFVKLPGVFDAPTLAAYEPAIARVLDANNKFRDVPLEQRDLYHRAFVQVINIWRHDEAARQLSFSRRLAQIATRLLGTRGVRMYHDQALFKEPGGGFTPWHVDQQYWPLSSGQCVTAWIPFQDTPIELGPLCFGRGSHLKNIGRDLAISEESERVIREAVKREGVIEVFEPYALGDVSFHYGWTLHRAGPNTSDRPRRVHTVIYIDVDMRLESKSANQKIDWEAFSPSTRPGEIMDDPLNPVLYETE